MVNVCLVRVVFRNLFSDVRRSNLPSDVLAFDVAPYVFIPTKDRLEFEANVVAKLRAAFLLTQFVYDFSCLYIIDRKKTS